MLGTHIGTRIHNSRTSDSECDDDAQDHSFTFFTPFGVLYRVLQMIDAPLNGVRGNIRFDSRKGVVLCNHVHRSLEKR